jgi:lipopolysaccharide/colanic/teichoic acid biosynthesis glycosyltransferase
MTGLWQVSGKNNLSFRQMVVLDIRYSRRISPWQDLWILARTAPAVLGQFSKKQGRFLGIFNRGC